MFFERAAEYRSSAATSGRMFRQPSFSSSRHHTRVVVVFIVTIATTTTTTTREGYSLGALFF
jgi:hypothetical protein